MKIIKTEFTNEIKSCEYNLWDEEETQEHINQCVKISDEHAINFCLWLTKKGNYSIANWNNTMPEMLKKYNDECNGYISTDELNKRKPLG